MICQKAFVYISILFSQVLSGSLLVKSHKQTMENGPCKKQVTHGQMSLNCSHQHLSYIPKIDSSVKILIFGYNDLTNVTAETFRNTSSPETLVGLQLDNNKIRNISSYALNIFKHLEVLYLSNNPIYYDNLKNLLGAVSGLQFLHEIRMSGISTIEIKKGLFTLMNGNHITHLGVEYYDMELISFDTFEMLPSLEILFLRHNQIRIVSLSKFTRLRSLYMNNNDLERIPKFSINGNESNCYFPSLEVLEFIDNQIAKLGKESFVCLRKLKILKIAGNRMKILPNDVFSKMPKLKLLNIEYLDGFNLHIEQFAFRSKSLESLQLGFHADADAVFDSVDGTFKHSPNLKYLDFKHIKLVSSQTLTRLFSPLTKLVHFHCMYGVISQDPKFMLMHMKSVESINFQSNRITAISDKTFVNNKRLKYLSLRLNELGQIHETALPMSLLNSLSYLDLSQNPFVCDCDLEWLINWMKTNPNKEVITRYPREYVCSKPTDKSNLKLSNISFSYKECHPWSPEIWVGVIGSPCLVVLCVAIVVMYRNRWSIKHYIFLLRKRRNYQKIPGNANLYNAFVAYEATDSVWVRRRLLPVLEGNFGLKLCIHERDFQIGAFINDNIVTNIDASEKIIVVLTNAFARSGWCMFELKIAHSRLIEYETELAIILLEKIDAKNMNQSLKVLFDTTTYIEWTEDAVGQALFWEKLGNVLKK